MSTLQKIAKITQAVLDQVTGADLPTLVLSSTWRNPSGIGLFTTAQRKIPSNTVAVQYTCASFIF